MPRRPPYRCANSSTSAALMSVAWASASMAATAVTVGYQQPRSSVVLAGDVTGMPARSSISSSSMRSPRVWIPRQPVLVFVDQLHRRRVVDPLATVHCGCVKPGDDSSAPTPQPPRLSAQCGRYRHVWIDVDVPEQPGVASAQLTFGQCSSSEGFATDEWLTHDGSVPSGAASVTSRIHMSPNVKLASRWAANVKQASRSRRTASPGLSRMWARRCPRSRARARRWAPGSLTCRAIAAHPRQCRSCRGCRPRQAGHRGC